LPERPTAKEIGLLAEPWRPWRGVAARLLWAYYRAIKQRDAIPVQP
jgi:DNA-3-methyladenine glycosylase II